MDEIKAMLTELAGTQKVEINNLDHVVSFSDAIWKDTRYFLAGVTDTKKRNMDDDIKKKNYFYADIDIRSVYLKKHWKILTDEEQDEEIIKILDRLSQRKIATMRYVVYTGNGLHLYYVWDEIEIDKTTYAKWVAYFYDIIDFALADLWYTCDQACKNIARISRLPWSINTRYKTQKNKETKQDELVWNMWPTECKILLENELDKTVFNGLKDYAQEWETAIVEKEIVKTYQKQDADIRAEINKIDILPIVCDCLWLKAKNTDKDTITLYDWKWAIGAYVYKPYNIVKRTGTTRLDRETYTTYEFVLHEICWNDKKATNERFEKHYNVKLNKQEEKKLEIPVIEKSTENNVIGFKYPWSVFDKLVCIMTGEVVGVIAPSNTGKTFFGLNIIKANNKIGKKWMYINLEFPIETTPRNLWLMKNWKSKDSLTDLNPLTSFEKANMDKYVNDYLSTFDHTSSVWWISKADLVQLIVDKKKQWFSLFVIDTFSKIDWNLDDRGKLASEAESMSIFQELVQKLNICIVFLHHTNKGGKDFAWSQKIKDLSNTFIIMEPNEDEVGWRTTKFYLSKDKFVTNEEIEVKFSNWEYLSSYM